MGQNFAEFVAEHGINMYKHWISPLHVEKIMSLSCSLVMFYAQTKAGWGRDDHKVKFNIADNASPVDITNIVIAEIRDENITLPEVKQLIELAQTRQKLTSLQPQDADSANKPSLEECLEIANKLLPTANILELQRENRELKKNWRHLLMPKTMLEDAIRKADPDFYFEYLHKKKDKNFVSARNKYVFKPEKIPDHKGRMHIA